MKFLRRLLLIVLFVTVVIGIGVWTCPADIAYAWFGTRLAPVTLGDLSGSVWHGHAGNMQVFGRELGALDWTLAPLPLLEGDLSAQIDLRGADTAAAATVIRHADHQLEIRDAKVQMPASVLDPAIGVGDLSMRGRIDINLRHAELRGAWIQSAEGDALWRDAAVAGAAQARLSDMRATFVTLPDGGIAGELRDLGGPLAADGMFTAGRGDYDAQLKLAARDADPHVLDALAHVGEPQADGSVLLKIRGHLLKIF